MAGPLPETPAPPSSVSSLDYSDLLKEFHTGQELLREAELRFRRLVETIPGVVYIAEPGEHGSWLYISPGLEELVGYSPELWIAEPTFWIELIHPDDRERVLADEAGWTETTGGLHVGEYRLRRRDGTYRWIRDSATARPGQRPGDAALWFGVLSDITESRDAQAALKSSEQLLRSVLETAHDAFVAIDGTGAVLEWNRRAEVMFGRPRGAALGRDITSLILPPEFRGASAFERVGRLMADAPGDLSSPIEMTAMHVDGTAFPIELTLWPTSSGTSVRYNAFIRDLTERKKLEGELRALAFNDSLTGLPNRALFANRLDQALHAGNRAATSVAVLFLDIDDFKTINDSLGHAAGDRLLRCVGERVRGILRPGDTVARFSGDEFAVLLPEVVLPADAVATAERIRLALAVPLNLEDRRTVISASIGVAISDRARPVSADDLLRNADAAMYHAKRAGKNTSVSFDPVMHTLALARLDLKADLEHALEHDELALVFQPYFALSSGSLVGYESLLRWTHPDRGSVPPSEFIPLAEETGLIHAIGHWVLHESCRQASSWQAVPGEPAPGINVNVSALQLLEPGLVEHVLVALRESDLGPDRLVLEITESVLLQEGGQTVARLEQLRSLGVRIAIDDFGTGYSSLSYLQHLPIDILKIDKPFVDRLGLGSDSSSSMASVILQIARNLKLEVVAEGVERPDQVQALRALGCDLAQGFFLGRPLTARDAAALCATHRPPVRAAR